MYGGELINRAEKDWYNKYEGLVKQHNELGIIFNFDNRGNIYDNIKVQILQKAEQMAHRETWRNNKSKCVGQTFWYRIIEGEAPW